MRKLLISILTVVLLAVVGFVLTGAMTSNASPKTASNRILTGEYHQTKGMPNTTMSATIADGKIKVSLRLDSGEEGDSNVYRTFWQGTFDTSNTSDTFTTISKPDVKVVNSSLYGSSETSKKFTYKNGDLSYEFSILGASTTVHLSK